MVVAKLGVCAARFSLCKIKRVKWGLGKRPPKIDMVRCLVRGFVVCVTHDDMQLICGFINHYRGVSEGYVFSWVWFAISGISLTQSPLPGAAQPPGKWSDCVVGRLSMCLTLSRAIWGR